MSDLSLEEVGEAAMEWQRLVFVAKEARWAYLEKLREVTDEERFHRDDPRWEAAKVATDVEYKAWDRARADARNALRRLERAARKCKS